MAKITKAAIKEEVLPVEQVVVETTPVVETEEAIEVGETIVEELPAPGPDLEDVSLGTVEEVFEITPEAEEAFAQAVEEEIQEIVEEVAPIAVEPVKEQVVAPRAGNEVGVRNIVQKTPSGFRLLLETGEIVKVSKAQYTKGQKTIIL